MHYQITKVYSVKPLTCGDALTALQEANGDTTCMHEFIDPAYPDEICEFHECWDWIVARHPTKMLYQIIGEIYSHAERMCDEKTSQTND